MKWGFFASTIFCIFVFLYLLNDIEPTAPAVQTETIESVETTTSSWEEIYHSMDSIKSEDAEALASLMMVQPVAYDYTARTFTFRIKYDERLFGDAPASFQESWEATIHSMPLSEAPSHDMKEYSVYVDINSLSLNYDPENMSFGAKFDIYADPNHTHPIDPVYVTYIWDEASNQFIMDLDSARIQLAG